ncbi:anti-sigma factor [Nonomuraea sp. LPB2021202275-12-8]|uniref:anti-sigma factor n=1 Tax=Nonomuraea sp. LPB2021202275-12-8 TaxID=3120159 RepID=UPI00300C37BB
MDNDLHALSGAYAVHALPPADVGPYEEHLSVCPVCPAEVRGLRETAARLALAVALDPPDALRPRVLAAVHRVRRRPPAHDTAHDTAGDATIAYRDPAGGAWDATVAHPPLRDAVGDGTLVHPAPGDEGADATLIQWPRREGLNDVAPGPQGSQGSDDDATAVLPRPVGGRDARTVIPERGRLGVVPSRRRWPAKVVAGLAAVAAAAAVAFGALAFDARQDLGEMRARDAAVAAVLAAPDARTVRQPVTAGGTGVFVLSRDQGRMVFTASGLPELPEAGVYELWLMGPGGMRPAGLLDRREDGLTAPLLATTLADDGHVGLTVEPAGGSRRPTTQPILFAELPAA